MTRLDFRSKIETYEQQAQLLLDSFRAGEQNAIDLIHRQHPRYRDAEVRWLPVQVSDEAIRVSAFDIEDARMTLAKWYCFQDFAALSEFAKSVANDPQIRDFEAAVEATIAGDLDALKALLKANPELARARSSRVCCFDPPRHRATLLHYIAANGVEGYRQKTPGNAPEISRELLRSGADANALANLYGGGASVMCMLISSSHPKEAGVRAELVEVLLDHGATIDACAREKCGSPLLTAVVFGSNDCAEVLLKRVAKVQDLAIAAGLGRLEDMKRLLAGAGAMKRHEALALAAQNGHVDCVRLLLD